MQDLPGDDSVDGDDDEDDDVLALGEVSIECRGLAAPKARVPVNDPSWPNPLYAETVRYTSMTFWRTMVRPIVR